jgi:hypothetical protein
MTRKKSGFLPRHPRLLTCSVFWFSIHYSDLFYVWFLVDFPHYA